MRALEHQRVVVPHPIDNRAGDVLTLVRLEEDDELISAALFAWMDGQPVSPDHLTRDQSAAVGRLLGQLHRAAVDFAVPESFTRPTLDGDGLFGDEGLYPIAPGADLITPEQMLIFSRVEEHVRRAMDLIGHAPDAFGLIHGDFIAKNLLWTPEGPAILDFETCGFGYFLYDFGPLLLQFRQRPDSSDLCDAWVSGYQQQRPVPPAQLGFLETFIAARHLASCRWLAAHLDHAAVAGQAPRLLTQRAAELRAFLETGAVPSAGPFL